MEGWLYFLGAWAVCAILVAWAFSRFLSTQKTLDEVQRDKEEATRNGLQRLRQEKDTGQDQRDTE